MSSYPSLTHDPVSNRTPRSGIAVDIAADGSVRGRSLYTAITYDFDILHPFLSSTDKDSVLAHYAANYADSFGYIWPDGSITHTVVYLDAPQVEWTPGGWNVRVRLAGRAS